MRCIRHAGPAAIARAVFHLHRQPLAELLKVNRVPCDPDLRANLLRLIRVELPAFDYDLSSMYLRY